MVSQAAHADLEIRILERQTQAYPVEITLNHEQEFPRGYTWIQRFNLGCLVPLLRPTVSACFRGSWPMDA